MKFLSVTAGIFLATTFFGPRALAQNQPLEADSCLSRLPASAFKVVPVFLEATADSTARAILPAADLFSQSVAFKLRELLGSDGATLPVADSIIGWRTLWGEAAVIAHRGGAPTLRIPEWSAGADSLPKSSLRLLVRAISEVIASGETVSIPESIPADSISFRLSFLFPDVTKQGKVIPVKGRQPIPVFTISVAWRKSPEMARFPRIDYPEISRTRSAVGVVRLAFAIDKNGQVDPESVREVWPAGIPKPQGDLLKAYEAFLSAVKRGLPTGKYSPASFGGCPVRQVVVQSFDFQVRYR